MGVTESLCWSGIKFAPVRRRRGGMAFCNYVTFCKSCNLVQDMYDNMSAPGYGASSPVVDRGIALHKMIRSAPGPCQCFRSFFLALHIDT
jgi:hypothetical protein